MPYFTTCNAVFYPLVTVYFSLLGGLAAKYCHHREIRGQVQQGKSGYLSSQFFAWQVFRVRVW